MGPAASGPRLAATYCGWQPAAATLTGELCVRAGIDRVEADGSLTVLAARYQGKRLNSPNDLVYKSDGSLYFTDPPFGLPKFFDDPRKELRFSGVFRAANGKVTLVTDELDGPNGLAFSPKEDFFLCRQLVAASQGNPALSSEA
jgi:sugar lactone lactonase YvrE